MDVPYRGSRCVASSTSSVPSVHRRQVAGFFGVGPAAGSSHDVDCVSRVRGCLSTVARGRFSRPSFAVAARLVLRRAPSRPFAVASRVPRVFLQTTSPCFSNEKRSVLHTLCLVHRAPDGARASRPPVLTDAWSAASRGVGALPFSRPAVCVSTPSDVSAAFGPQTIQCLSVLVRPRRFSRPRRFAPHTHCTSERDGVPSKLEPPHQSVQQEAR